MNYDVVEARYVGRYVVWLRFRDNTSGEIDLEKELYGPVFEPLRDPDLFKQFQIHPEFHTLTWSNGADFAPEYLHDNVRVTALKPKLRCRLISVHIADGSPVPAQAETQRDTWHGSPPKGTEAHRSTRRENRNKPERTESDGNAGTALWTTVSGFESLPPSQVRTQVGTSLKDKIRTHFVACEGP